MRVSEVSKFQLKHILKLQKFHSLNDFAELQDPQELGDFKIQGGWWSLWSLPVGPLTTLEPTTDDGRQNADGVWLGLQAPGSHPQGESQQGDPKVAFHVEELRFPCFFAYKKVGKCTTFGS